MSQVAPGVQPWMLPLSWHTVFAFQSPAATHIPGSAWRRGASASSNRHCQLSATSPSPTTPNFQPWQNWLHQPHIRNKKLFTGDTIPRKVPGCHRSGAFSRSDCQPAGRTLLTSQGGSPLPRPLHIPPACSPCPCWEGSPFPQCPLDVVSMGLGLWLYQDARCRGEGGLEPSAILSPSPVGMFPNLLLNGT